MTFPLHTALVERLKLVREGVAVLIRYTGTQLSKGGRVFKGFEVFVPDDEALIQPDELLRPVFTREV